MACSFLGCHPLGPDNALPPRSCRPENHADRREGFQAGPGEAAEQGSQRSAPFPPTASAFRVLTRWNNLQEFLMPIAANAQNYLHLLKEGLPAAAGRSGELNHA